MPGAETWLSVAGFHNKSDSGPLLVVDSDIDKRRDTDQLYSRRGKKTARDGDSLDGLVERASPNGLELGSAGLPYCAGQGACDSVRLRMGRDS